MKLKVPKTSLRFVKSIARNIKLYTKDNTNTTSETNVSEHSNAEPRPVNGFQGL